MHRRQAIHPHDAVLPLHLWKRPGRVVTWPTVPAMTVDPESVVPAASKVHVVPLAWDGARGRHQQREGARQAAAVLYARMSAGFSAAEWAVYRFLDAWRQYLRLSLAGVTNDLPLLTGEPISLDGEDVLEHWAVVQPVLLGVWPDAAGDAASASRALVRLRTAFNSDRVDVAAVHREMLAVTNVFGDLEARAQAQLQFDRDQRDR
jgi:hypothetical protein